VSAKICCEACGRESHDDSLALGCPLYREMVRQWTKRAARGSM
jgi:hypothetical protein